MSLPTFPDSGLDITEDQALNMILTSIAMEELALSHIMNAEGEKLQYILGTLPGKHSPCATTAELLEVNRSITNLLDVVMSNQLLLKGKMERVLDVKRTLRPDPPSPCPCKCSPTPNCCPDCRSHRCPESCAEILRLVQANSSCTWKCESRFLWKLDKFCSEMPSWGRQVNQSTGPQAVLFSRDPSIVVLPPQQTFCVYFAFRFQNPETSAVTISLDFIESGSSRQIFCMECRGRTLTGNTSFTTPAQSFTKFCITLHCPDCVCVESASLMIVPLCCD